MILWTILYWGRIQFLDPQPGSDLSLQTKLSNRSHPYQQSLKTSDYKLFYFIFSKQTWDYNLNLTYITLLNNFFIIYILLSMSFFKQHSFDSCLIHPWVSILICAFHWCLIPALLSLYLTCSQSLSLIRLNQNHTDEKLVYIHVIKKYHYLEKRKRLYTLAA